MNRPAAVALALLASLALPARSLRGQHVSLGPLWGIADYREVAAGLRYRGTGYGGVVSLRFHRLRAEAAVARLTFDTAGGSTAGQGFKATQIDAWVAYDVSRFASLLVGLTRRTADPEFEAQSIGAVRVGARSAYEIGPGAVVSLRANYLGASKFSGGGRAPFAMELALGLDVRLFGRIRGMGSYEFQRLDRKTDPGGGGTISVPIQQSLARIGAAVAF